MNVFPTSEGTLLSSIHGRDRRHLRKICRKDLLAARKYGTKERTYGYQRQPRWKFTYADIVYITENDEISEVTSYVLPVDIPLISLSASDYTAHDALVHKMRSLPSMCSSHFVIVVDQSASMCTCDVDHHKTRSDAVFATIALDYFGKQIDHRQKTNANYTDVVTLIEMSVTSSVVFEREPCTNVLYNKIVERKKTVYPRGHGMFRSAIDTAFRIMNPDCGNSNCPLFLLFLSDGKPSDFINDQSFDCGQHVFNHCHPYGPQLTVVTLGFGKLGSDFSVLQTMAAYARSAGCSGMFQAVDTRGDALSTVMGTISDTMSATRCAGSVLRIPTRGMRTTRVIDVETPPGPFYNFSTDHDNIYDGTWDLYTDGFNCLIWDKNLQRLIPNRAGEGIAIRKQKLGVGAERLVFRLVEITRNTETNKWEPIHNDDGRLVAKEGKYQEDLRVDQFHQVFCRTQRQASKLADKFNHLVKTRCHLHGISVPAIIKFLPCFVFEVPELHGDGYRAVLGEKRLDPSKYMKWNSNNGYVSGPQRLVDVLNKLLCEPMLPPRHHALETMEEGNEDEELSDEDEEQQEEEGNVDMDVIHDSTTPQQAYFIIPEHVPQAFSHHTFRYTQRKQLVCDLQGVLDVSTNPPVFELTDPVIHSNYDYKSGLFGKTDHGHKGMRDFMNSHICNDLCHLLGLVQYTTKNNTHK